MTWDQIIIAITGSLASWMIHDDRKRWRLWACILALVGQPAWFYAAFIAHQWGILAMDLVWSVGWVKGFWKNWKD